MKLEVLGIRHHGVGSAINTLQRLKEIQPDYILVEGPEELMQSIKDVDLETFEPPLAILVYNPNELQQSSFYPFAEFSPEWQAFKFAKSNRIDFSTADLPAKFAFALRNKEEDETEEESFPLPIHNRPMEEIAKADGYDDADSWWEHHFEQKKMVNAAEHFSAILEVMTELRDTYVNRDYHENERREAFMREAIRNAKKSGYENVVFVCGAWHAPAILDYKSKSKADKLLLKKLPKVKIETSWIPWLNSRLAWKSGYGAGLQYPGWYEHLWQYQQDDGRRWLTKAAQIFRAKEFDISTAHIIEAHRLSQSLAYLRDLPRPGLKELDESIIAVMCMGEEIMLQYIKEHLTIGSKMGVIPDDQPKLPIQKDFDKKTKSFRLPIREDEKLIKLDLREPKGLQKSIFFHRLHILEITWANLQSVRTKGTFKEVWSYAWQPEHSLQLIDKGIWGNSIEIAAINFVNNLGKTSNDLILLAELIKKSIIAELFDSIDFLIHRIDNIVSLSSDVAVLMETIIPLIEISRYSDIRQTDQTILVQLIEDLSSKININLATACYGLDEEMAQRLFLLISKLNDRLSLLDRDDLITDWLNYLELSADETGISPLIQGAFYRILLDTNRLDNKQVQIGFSKALSVGQDPIFSAAWIEGFLKGSVQVLILDNKIWNILYTWLHQLDKSIFDQLLPILRRTFSKFSSNDRFKIGKKATKGISLDNVDYTDEFDDLNFNFELANKALLATKKILQL